MKHPLNGPNFSWVYMGMDQYLLIPFLVGWTSIYQLFGTQFFYMGMSENVGYTPNEIAI